MSTPGGMVAKPISLARKQELLIKYPVPAETEPSQPNWYQRNAWRLVAVTLLVVIPLDGFIVKQETKKPVFTVTQVGSICENC